MNRSEASHAASPSYADRVRRQTEGCTTQLIPTLSELNKAFIEQQVTIRIYITRLFTIITFP